MKKRLLISITSMIMVFMMSTMMVFADSTVEGNMTSAEFLANSNEQGIITLSQDTTIVDALKVDAQNYIIDLNGHTLKFTKDTNTFTNNANVTFRNGSINLDGIKEGEKNKAIEIAKSMINIGLDKETIAKSTGLDLSEVEKLIDELD